MTEDGKVAARGIVLRWPGWATRLSQAGAIAAGLYVFAKLVLWGVAVITLATKLTAIEKYLVQQDPVIKGLQAQVAELATTREAAGPKPGASAAPAAAKK